MYTGGYQGLTFRPTTYKKDSVLRCIPINLHTQLMRVSEQQSFADAVTFENITFGAPAAHCFKFKTNLRVLHETRMKLLQQATALAEANGQPVCAALLPPCKLLPTALVSPETSMNAPVSAGLTFLGSEQLRKYVCMRVRVAVGECLTLAYNNNNRLEEVEYLLMERSDVCIPQALAALVTSFLQVRSVTNLACDVPNSSSSDDDPCVAQKLELSIDNSAFQEQLAAVGYDDSAPTARPTTMDSNTRA